MYPEPKKKSRLLRTVVCTLIFWFVATYLVFYVHPHYYTTRGEYKKELDSIIESIVTGKKAPEECFKLTLSSFGQYNWGITTTHYAHLTCINDIAVALKDMSLCEMLEPYNSSDICRTLYNSRFNLPL